MGLDRWEFGRTTYWTEGILGAVEKQTICRGAKPPSEVLSYETDGILGALTIALK